MHYKTTKKTAFSQHHCSVTKFDRDYSCVQTQIRWWKIKGSEEQFRQMQSVWSGSIILASRWVPHAPTSTYDKLKQQRLLTEHWVSIIAERETIKRRTAGSFRFLQTSTTVFALLLLESSHPVFQTQKPQKTGSLFFPSLLSAKFLTPLLPLILISLEALFILVSHIHFQIRVKSNRCQLTVCKYQQDANASQMGTSKCIWTFTQQSLCSAALSAELIWSF